MTAQALQASGRTQPGCPHPSQPTFVLLSLARRRLRGTSRLAGAHTVASFRGLLFKKRRRALILCRRRAARRLPLCLLQQRGGALLLPLLSLLLLPVGLGV